MRIIPLFAAASALLLAGCEQQSAETPAAADMPAPEDTGPAPEFYSYDGWIGKWIGVEGMYVEIAPVGDGTYRLDMQSDLETTGSYIGTPDANGISFDRGGARFTLREATGDQTGLKYLMGKADCLMVVTGEGYCRD